MRTCWRSSALMLLLAAWPQFGCTQLPNLGSVQAKSSPPSKSVQPLERDLAAGRLQPPPSAQAAAQPDTASPTTPSALSPAEMANGLAAQADTLEKSGRSAEAVATYERLRQFGGEYSLHATRRLAVLHDRAGDLDRAEQECQLLRQFNQKDSAALSHLGQIHYRLGRMGTAFRHLEDAVTYGAKDPHTKTALGLTLAQLTERGDYSQSLGVLKTVMSEADAYCHIAHVMNTQGKREAAINALQTALAKEPNMPRALAALTQMKVTPTSGPALAQGKTISQPGRGNVEIEEPLPPVIADAGMHHVLSQRRLLPAMAELDLSSASSQPGEPAGKKADR